MNYGASTALAGVVGNHPQAALQRHLDDPLPHGAAPDDTDDEVLGVGVDHGACLLSLLLPPAPSGRALRGTSGQQKTLLIKHLTLSP